MKKKASNIKRFFRRAIAWCLAIAMLICGNGYAAAYAVQAGYLALQDISSNQAASYRLDTVSGEPEEISGSVSGQQEEGKNTIPEQSNEEDTSGMPGTGTQTVSGQPEDISGQPETDVSGQLEDVPGQAETDVSGQLEDVSGQPENMIAAYAEGTIYYQILISTEEQLRKVGTGASVDDLLQVKYFDRNGNEITPDVSDGDAAELPTPVYGEDTEYVLMNDIELTKPIWTLPEGFTGTFLNGAGTENYGKLYDADTDTLYLYHPLQLEAAASADAGTMQVKSLDYNMVDFGKGEPVYRDAAASASLTYGDAGNYILSSAFYLDEKPSELTGTEVPTVPDGEIGPEGRDNAGQTSVTVDDKDFILIGDKQQLQEIDAYSAASGESSVAKATAATGPVWKVTYAKVYSLSDGGNRTKVSAELVYPGDADLTDGVEKRVWQYANLTYKRNGQDVSSVKSLAEPALISNEPFDFSGYALNGWVEKEGKQKRAYHTDGGWTNALLAAEDPELGKEYIQHTEAGLVTIGFNYVGGTLDAPDDNITSYNIGSYTTDSNYIVFRDIDLENDEWKPLMFTGEMYGIKAADKMEQGTLWKSDKSALKPVNTANPNPAVISNINVEPIKKNEKLNINKNIGVGFFGTISGKYNDSFISQKTIVQNIKLSQGTVYNPLTACQADITVVSGLLSAVGSLLGGAVSGAVWLLTVGQVKLNLDDTLSKLLNARAQTPDSLATGGFAGRIIGDASVTYCSVEGISVNTVATTFETGSLGEGGKQIVGKGGFVGYVEGETQYDGLSNLLGGAVKGLSGLLNLIPGLGLGDLITILLENVLNVGSLIPIGYTAPEIKNCSVIRGTLSEEDGKYGVGGFAGSVSGTSIENCSVIGDMTINAEKYGGGFVGVLRDAVIAQTLSGLGINADFAALQTQSLLLGDSVSGNIQVKGTSCLGGIAGIIANSYCINCDADGALSVKASGNYAGGVTGFMTMGSTLGELGDNLPKNPDLLSTVKDLLTGLLGSGEGEGLLSLMGVSPSAVMGIQIRAQLTVEAGGSYAGGIAGQGDGAYITASTQDNMMRLVKYKLKKACPNVAARRNSVNDLVSVTAKQCAGGIAGYLTTGNVAGLLDKTLGVASFIGFRLSETDVNSTGGYIVSAQEDYAGGGIGMAQGGDVLDVSLSGLKSVTAGKRAGGFVGATGPGSLAQDGGINLKLLGLDLLQINNLLQVVNGLRTTYTDVTVNGAADGFTVAANDSGSPTIEYAAGGFAGKASSAEMLRCSVKNLAQVSANKNNGKAGGFVGVSSAGGLLDAVDEGEAAGSEKKNLIGINGLLSAVPYLIPYFNDCHVSYADGGFVQADYAGGFAGDFQSGKVNTEQMVKEETEGTDTTGEGEGSGITSGSDGETAGGAGNPGLKEKDFITEEGFERFSVHNIDHVSGGEYAGGFGGRVYSGALIQSGSGIQLLGVLNLNINVNDLLGVVNAYVPIIKYAGVESRARGLMVSALPEDGSKEGYAGGYIGYGSGVQISECDVENLRNTPVNAPKDLNQKDGSSYFDSSSQYAVKASSYAGGYIGFMNIGSAAAAGDGGLSILGDTLKLDDIASALQVVVSTIEHSDVTGAPGGFSVLAREEKTGYAGGFAGKIKGGHIQDCNAYNFAYIIGQTAAGGYMGELTPGNAADVLGEVKVLNGLVTTEGNLLTALQDFVPTVHNSETTCIPCGGAVRANASYGTASGTVTDMLRGMAGGYCGHNEGGHIWGNDERKWKTKEYTGPIRECAAVRIMSVYGQEYAGGFTGLMESASTASVGSLSVLFGLVKVQNPLGALSIVYPTEENTAVYGPLAELSEENWNSWVTWVGQFGGYGYGFSSNPDDYRYGYSVTAGRDSYNSSISDGGCAGGYVGAMHSGTITNGQAHDAMKVTALRTAGGFAGEAMAGGATSLGDVTLFGDFKIELGNTVSALEMLVPKIEASSVTGYQSGLNVAADSSAVIGAETDDITVSKVGYAGGYIGYASGAQIWGLPGQELPDGAGSKSGCNVLGLKQVSGTNAIGGYVGMATAGAVADVSTSETSNSIIQGVLNALIETPGSLVQVLNATLTVIREACVSSADPDWGFVVDGKYGDSGYADYAGGFAGKLEAVVIGKEKLVSGKLTADMDYEQKVLGLRGVIGGHYAGGFFGLADMGSVAKIGGEAAGDNNTNLLLKLLELNQINVLDAFRSYIYNGKVEGVQDGFSVQAYEAGSYDSKPGIRYSGDAGGFGGALMNGSAKSCSVSGLLSVEGPNYVGGFVGHMGKGGVADVGGLGVLGDTIQAKLDALNVFGSHAESCSVAGVPSGFVVINNRSDMQPIAGGFAGYAEVARISDDTVKNLSKVKGAGTAGGFVGQTEMTYLVNADVNSPIVNAIFAVVDVLLGTDGVLPAVEVLREYLRVWINLGIVEVKVGGDNLVYVELLGLPITIDALDKNSNVAKVTIGNSKIELKLKDGKVDREDESNLQVNLIKGNRTEIENCTVWGISQGYDVLGGAGNTDYAGGFAGLNQEGKITGCQMYLCDTVEGAAGNVGPFTGKSTLDTVYGKFGDTLEHLESGNSYRIYRTGNLENASIETDTETFANGIQEGGRNVYQVSFRHGGEQADSFEYLKDAVEKGTLTDASGTQSVTRPLGAYASAAKAILMADSFNQEPIPALTPEPADMLYPCEEEVELTFRKVWDDLGNRDKIRPASVNLRVYWTRVDTMGRPVDAEGNPLTLNAEGKVVTAADGDSVITELPKAGSPKADGGTWTDEEVLAAFWHDGAYVDEDSRENPLASALGGSNLVVMEETADASKWTATWKKVISGFEVGRERNIPAEEVVPGELSREIAYYYAYMVREEPVAGYTTAYTSGIAISGTAANTPISHVFTITNRHEPELPLTGAGGGLYISLLGVGFIALGSELFLRRRRRRRRRQQYIRRLQKY